MNFSPLNDPSFEEHRRREAEKAAKKRRKKTLIILVSVSLVLLAATVLLVFAALDTFPEIFANTETTGEAPTGTPEPTPAQTASSEPSSDVPVVVPSKNTPSESPSPTQNVPTETPTPTVNVRTTTVYVDAGHGFLNSMGDAMDKGAGNKDYPYYKLSEEQTGIPMYESDLVLILAKKVKAILEENGYTVIMSREDYVYERVPINLRAEKARNAGADLLVSIHANSAEDATVNGARVFYNDNPEWELCAECRAFAQTVAEKIDAYGASQRKSLISSGRSLAMLRGTGNIPSILVETCFLTNEEDSKLALTETWQDNMAKAIAEGVMQRYKLQTQIL